MKTQLAGFLESHGPSISVDGRIFQVDEVVGEDDMALATLSAGRAKFTGVLYVGPSIVRNKPGAEVWRIIKGRKTVGMFVLWQNTLLPYE